MNIKEFNKEYNHYKLHVKHPNVPAYIVPVSKFAQNGSNPIRKALVALFEMIGGIGTRVNAAGVARGVKVTMAAYTDVLGNMHSARTEPKYVSAGTRSEPDVSGNFVNDQKVPVSVKIEIKYGRDTLKDHQKERLDMYAAAGCICIVTRDFDYAAGIIMDLKKGIVDPYKNKINKK